MASSRKNRDILFPSRLYCRLWNHTRSCQKARGLYRRWGIAPRPKEMSFTSAIVTPKMASVHPKLFLSFWHGLGFAQGLFGVFLCFLRLAFFFLGSLMLLVALAAGLEGLAGLVGLDDEWRHGLGT